MNTLLPIIITTPIFLLSCSPTPNSAQLTKQFLSTPSNVTAISYSPPLRGAISRHQAITHALASSPKLQSQRAELRALQAERVQAGLPPNPELDVEIENFGGNGSSRAFNGAEITAAISQRIEVGNKRSKRTIIAALAVEKLRAQILSDEKDVRIATDKAFTSLLEAQKLQALSEQNHVRSEKNLEILNTLLEAGISNRIDVGKAKLDISAAKGNLIKAQSDVSNAAARLSQIWGDGSANVTAKGQLTNPTTSNFPSNQKVVARHPAIRAAAMNFAHSKAVYDLEKSKRFSDVKLGGGIRERRDADETAAVMSLSIPLPFTNRNQGNIIAAQERITKSQAEGKATESELRMRLAGLTSDLRSARSRTAEFSSRAISSARQTLDDTLESYSAGKVSLLAVLDARETLYKVERRNTRAKADLLRAHNSLKTLTNN